MVDNFPVTNDELVATIEMVFESPKRKDWVCLASSGSHPVDDFATRIGRNPKLSASSDHCSTRCLYGTTITKANRSLVLVKIYCCCKTSDCFTSACCHFQYSAEIVAFPSFNRGFLIFCDLNIIWNGRLF